MDVVDMEIACEYAIPILIKHILSLNTHKSYLNKTYNIIKLYIIVINTQIFFVYFHR